MHINQIGELAAISPNVKFTIEPDIIEQCRGAAILLHKKLVTNGRGDYKLLVLPGRPIKPGGVATKNPPGRPRSGKWLPMDDLEVGQTISVTLNTETRNPLQYIRNMASAQSQRSGWKLSVSASADGVSANITRNS